MQAQLIIEQGLAQLQPEAQAIRRLLGGDRGKEGTMTAPQGLRLVHGLVSITQQGLNTQPRMVAGNANTDGNPQWNRLPR